MSDLPSKSPLQFEHLPGGQVQLVGRPDVVLKVHQDQANTSSPEWERTLKLPTYQEEWDELARADGLSARHVRFILCDQQPTKHVGNWRLQPACIRVRQGNYLFTLGHTGYAIGLCTWLRFHPTGTARALWKMPDFVEGDCLIGEAQLYDSPLADIAWRGLQEGIFSHTCAVLAPQPGDQDGAGDLIEIALVSEIEAACPGARIMKAWQV